MATTIELVTKIIDTNLQDVTIESYIDAATTFVDDVVGNEGLSSDLTAELERWLTAHMISTTREKIGAEEEAGGAKIKYEGVTGEGLKSSHYGQMVIMLDSTGKFAAIGGGKKKANITFI